MFFVSPQIDPEPLFLLLMHGIVSVSMLYDPITTFAFIVVIVSVIFTFGDCDLPTERLVIFVISVTVPAIFGKVAASITCVLVGVAIILYRLRPLYPESLALLALGSLAITLLVNKVVATIVVFTLITILTGLYVLNKVKKRALEVAPVTTQPPPRNISSHPNGYLPLSNPTESLDLHGHSVTGAMKVLHMFLQEHEEEYRKNRSRHIRHVTIITGDTCDNKNLIRPTVENFLKINRYKYDVSTEVPGLVKVDLESHVL
nr:hypothetical protein BgiMline_010259 [Biomphalaria glabrata]